MKYRTHYETYRKKPVEVGAVQFDGTKACFENIKRIMKFHKSKRMPYDFVVNERFLIPTLEGDHIVSKGDFVIKGVKGEFYGCKPDIFKMTYVSVHSGEIE